MTTTTYHASRLAPPVGVEDKALQPYSKGKIYRIVALHAVFGVLFHISAFAATLHALGVGILAFYFVISSSDVRRYLLLAGYVVSSEVLWRMSSAAVPWMYAEYLILFLVVFGLMRVHGNLKTVFLPLYYAISLLPSIIFTLLDSELSHARELLAFNLSGPFALGLGMFAVTRLRLEVRNIHKAVLFAVLPIVSIVAITMVAVYFEGVQYNAISESNSAAAGGYSANQVSSVISFGVVMLLILLFLVKEYQHVRNFFRLLVVVFIAQMLLTLSRGGTMNLAAFLLFGLPFFFKTHKARQRFVISIAMLTAVVWFFVLPALDSFTGGALDRRYSDDTSTNRTTLMEYELQAFYDSPLLGQGPGNSSSFFERRRLQSSDSHTEYTRVLADHGIVGGIGMLLLCGTFVLYFMKSNKMWKKGMVLGSAAWIFAYFTHSASRTLPFAFMGMLSVLFSNSYDRDLEDPNEL